MNIQAAEAPATVATLVMSGISKSFGGVAALTDVSLEVRPGEVHALLGENGAGKSTLMNVATGTIRPDAGSMVFRGEPIDGIDPRDATRLGIAFVHQHPAVLPDMTVYENLLVALPPAVFAEAPSREEFARSLLARVNLRAHLSDRVETLSVAQKHLLEIAKAIAVKPALLVLDEPTAPLGEDAVRMLFRLVREFVAGGTSVVYITHRLAEVRELADRVTVLRDGRLRATAVVDEISDRELLALIVGRQLDSTFPPKHDGPDEAPNFIIEGLTGPGFKDVSLTARRGEIIGIAGVVGNGQSDLLRALAGLSHFEGSVSINGTQVTSKRLLGEAAYLPADRLSEGLMMRLTVRENAAISALERFRTGRLLNRKRELGMVGDTLGSLSVKAASLDAPVSSLSGGNQQKVMVGRALLSEPELVLADEPTQGVDVGARAEIYQILREVSASGIPVIVASSDAKELEGLCDTVIVMSRGHVVDVLRGDDLTEERMIHAAVSSTTSTVGVEDITDADVDERTAVRRAKIRRFVQGDYAPAVLLVAVMVLLGAFIFAQNDRYLGAFNISAMLLLVSALGFIAMGQTIALLTGGIDLSVGPLVGFLVVIGSFFILNESSTASILLGFAAMLGTSIVVGLVNGTLIRYVKFTAIAATLTVYIALQGMSFILRPTAGGYINADISRAITTKIGPIPVAFIVLVLVVVALEYALRRTPWGWRLRAAGSDEESARRVGVEINRTVVLAYVATSVLTFFGAIMLMTQIGVGDPAQGVAYTLSSITAVVLGGTSLLGGRGTFVGTLFGAMLLVQVLNATVFLRLDQMWQYILQGILILAAAILYAVARSKRRRRAARKV
ncbi:MULTISPECIES: ATP-binding cassette domain-containing protein [unclassified Agromyces]|uniref:ATP-binding cassette domain-containing protein n=1 Tax=unclassified Agromyces TaxID=2639701 RepID=UPI0007B2D739|nr:MULTISPECIES: ATP-binding cassette domain-containing protein [unclassified Agromyces]KZE92892.1 Ribose import ATP-binding protein RbsA [Agromyces sp. NDB4Y10]MCK8608047.1 ATP-binding cassette domain-containing protein [Agromyces sp. C10]